MCFCLHQHVGVDAIVNNLNCEISYLSLFKVDSNDEVETNPLIQITSSSSMLST
jgi:hypothetical protein